MREMEKVPITEFTWCLEVCKGEAEFKRKALNLKSDVTGKLIQKFKEARNVENILLNVPSLSSFIVTTAMPFFMEFAVGKT